MLKTRTQSAIFASGMNHHHHHVVAHQHHLTSSESTTDIPAMLAGLIHRVEDAVEVLTPLEQQQQQQQRMSLEDRQCEDSLMTSAPRSTTASSLGINQHSPSSSSHNSNIMNHHFDRRPAPMLPSPPLKAMATTSSPTASPPVSKDASGFHHLSRAKIDEFLQPMLQSLTELDAEALLQSQRVEHGAQVRDGVRIQPIHTKIIPPQPPDCVRYLHIAEVPDQYSIGIFVFPPHARIPLHDHPGMCVLSRVLYGEVTRTSLDLLPEPDEMALLHQLEQQEEEEQQRNNNNSHQSENNNKSWLSSSMTRSLMAFFPPDVTSTSSSSSTTAGSSRSSVIKPRRRLAIMNGVDRLIAPQVTSLYPYEGNLHEFVAGPDGAAVLDVLLPPYGQEDCTFYDIVPLAIAATHQHPNKERCPCWIVPTGQPEEFHCLSGRFMNIGSNGNV